MTVALDKAPSGQQLYDLAASLGQVPLLVTMIGVLRSPRPVALLEWMLEVETDETARRGLAAGLAVLRAQNRGGDR